MNQGVLVKHLLWLLTLLIVPGCKQQMRHGLEQVDGSASFLSAKSAGHARWSPKINLSLVPGAAAHLPDGRILFWSAADRFNFIPGRGKTQALFFDPETGQSTHKEVFETHHDMFCPGTTNLAGGQVLINGGKNSEKTTIYDPELNQWIVSGAMAIPRGYQSNTILPDGSVFTFGGSWSGDPARAKDAEVWHGGKWRTLPHVKMDPNFYAEYAAIAEGDNHLWLQPMSNGRVLHFGPGIQMHWIDTAGDGDVEPVGPRADDESAINGSAVMFDIDRILKVGGARHYGTLGQPVVEASQSAYEIELAADGKVRTTKLSPMKYRRVFSNAIVLPGGQVLVAGGQTKPKLFSDDNGVMVPEIWDPRSKTFFELPAPPELIARNYHSVALLLNDARVLIGGGGMIGRPAADHPDVQILSPPYLFNTDGTPAIRPEIVSAPATAANGTSFPVASSQEIAAFELIRMSSVTHTINNDQRRIPLTFSVAGRHAYNLSVPENPSVALPGYYMLFAINHSGVPSVARQIRIDGTMAIPASPDAPADVYVWRFKSSTSVANPVADEMDFTWGISSDSSMPQVPDGYAVDPDAEGFLFRAWGSEGQGRIPVFLCQDQRGRHLLQANGCDGSGGSRALFFAYGNAVPGTSKILRFTHVRSGAHLMLPGTARSRGLINQLEGFTAASQWIPRVRRGPQLENGVFFANSHEPDRNPDLFVWRFYGAPSPSHPDSRWNYMYLVTNNPVRPAPPPGFLPDPTAPTHIFQAWSTHADGRIPVSLCQQPASRRFWMGAGCAGDRTVRHLFYAYPRPVIDTVKVLHYTNIRWGGKLLIPDHPATKLQIDALDDLPARGVWTGWITRKSDRLQPFFVSTNSCLMNGNCFADEPDLQIWRFYSKVLPTRPDPRSDYYYTGTISSGAPVPPADFQADPTSPGPSFRAWSSPGRERIPVFQCQNRQGKQFWIGNGCAGDTQRAVMFYAYPKMIPGTVRVLHYLSTRWQGKLILPDIPELKSQIDALDRPPAWDPWVAAINRTTRMDLGPFWVRAPNDSRKN